MRIIAETWLGGGWEPHILTEHSFDDLLLNNLRLEAEYAGCRYLTPIREVGANGAVPNRTNHLPSLALTVASMSNLAPIA